jgi:hypothetical protein
MANNKKVGRPSKQDPETVTKLLAAFSRGYNVQEACIYACVSRETYYRWVKDDCVLSGRIEAARTGVSGRAKEIIVDAILNGDINAAKWWLERRAKREFGPDAIENYEAPLPVESDEAKLQEQLDKHIALKYRKQIFREREALLHNFSKNNEYLIKRLDKLLQLTDHEIAKADVRRLLQIRLGGENYKDILKLADETEQKYNAMLEAEKQD